MDKSKHLDEVTPTFKKGGSTAVNLGLNVAKPFGLDKKYKDEGDGNSKRRSLASGGSIYIKPSHRGRLTKLKARTGKSEAELYNDGNPAHKKMVVFARNARKWNN